MKIRFLPLILLCLLLGGCSRAVAGGHLISAAEGSEEYCTVLNTFLPGYIPREPEDTLYAEVSRGNAVACFDVQAVPAMRRGVGRYWYPHVLGTVVLAVDRTRTNEVITGWGSLLHSRTPVGMSSFSVIRNMLAMGALSYGLNQKEPAKQDALDFLEHLNRNGGFELDGSDAPILICLDYEVAEWNRNGENYEIIVPEEGTLSFRLGLLSDSPLALEPGLDEALLSAGLPPASGERPQGFPGDYSAAHTLSGEDYGWFLELAGDSSRDLRRQVLHIRRYTTADLREHILSALLLAAAILLWKGTVSHRMIRRDVRRVVGVMGWLMVGWLLLRLFKYQLTADGILCRMCWYGYYIFQLALPVTLLYLAVILDHPEGEKKPLRPLWPPLACYALSVLLVLTNDLHQLVFRFDPAGDWASDYRYGPGYWIVAAFSLLFFALALVKLFCKGRRSKYWGGKVFPLLFCAALLAYVIAYIYRIPLAWESDITVCICIISVLFFETVLRAGLIPVNIRYHRLFAAAPISLALLDEDGRTVLSSRDASPISRSIWRRLLTDMEHPLLRDNDTQLHAVAIHGGMSVREMEAIAVGLEETMDEDVISQGPIFIDFMCKELMKRGVPVVTPAGGLGCHLNAREFLPHVDDHEYPAGALAAAVYLAGGVRGMERGTLSEQREPDGTEPIAEVELLRLAMPRRVFTMSQVLYAVDRITWLHENRDLVGGLRWVEEPSSLRFFFGRLEPTSDWQEKLVKKFRDDFGDSL